MSSPGGDEVGRVSVRVVPDTSGFRRDLQRELDAIENSVKLKIPVTFDIDTAALRAELESIRAAVEIPVTFDADIAGLRVQIAALDNSRITIPVDLDVDTAALRAELDRLDARTINIRVSVDGVALALAELAALESVVDRLDGRTIRIGVDVDTAAALAHIAAIEAALLSLRGSIGSLGGGGGGVGGGGAGGIGGFVAALGIAVVLAPALAVAGAAITVAWGAVATAIAAVPAALFLLAAPIAAVALGIDGIGKAAQQLKPQFDALKASVSATFERGFLPVFKELQAVFPTLTTGLNGIATALSGTALNLAQFVSSGQGLLLLDGVFRNVGQAIRDISPGIQDVVKGFLLVAQQGGAFDAITRAVNTFGFEFQKSVLDLVNKGTLQSAFAGLGDVLAEVAQAFVGLVENGINVFAAAAPGVTSFLDDLTGFFSRFDFGALGAAAGAVFEGLGQALDGVDTGTIKAIEQSFTDLGNVFKGQQFQADLQNMISGIPAAVGLIGDLTEVFGTIGSAVAEGLKAFDGADQKFRDFTTGLQAAADGLGTIIPQGVKDAAGGLEADLDTFFFELFGVGEAAGQGVADGITSSAPAIDAAGSQAAAGVPPAVAEGLAPVGPTAAGILNQLSPIVQTAFSGLSVHAALGMATVAAAVQSGGATVANSLRVGLFELAPIMSAAFIPLRLGAAVGMLQVSTAIESGFTLVRAAFDAGFAGVSIGATAAFIALAGAAAIGMQAVGLAVTAGMVSVAAAVDVGFANLSISATTAFLMLAGTAAIGMQAVNLAVTAGMVAVVAAVAVGFGNVATAAVTGLLQLSATAAVGMQGVVLAVTAGMVAVNAALTVGFGSLNTAAVTAFLGLQATVAVGMQGVVAAVTAGSASAAAALGVGLAAMSAVTASAFAQVAATVAAGMQGATAAVAAGASAMTAAMAAAMAQFVATISNGMASAQAVVAAGSATITAAVAALGARITSIAASSMASFTSAIRSGMASAQGAVASGVSSMIGTLNGAVGSFRAAGSNMGSALAAGLRSQLGAVQSAAAALANAAAAGLAAAAKIRSPSRVFIHLGEMMGTGLVVGLDDSQNRIIASARDLVDGIVGETDRLQDVFTNPGGFDAFRQLEGRIRTAVAVTGPAGADSGIAEMVIELRAQTRELVAALREAGLIPAAATAQYARTSSAMGAFG